MKPEIEENTRAERVSGHAEIDPASIQAVVKDVGAGAKIVEESKEQDANEEEEKKSEGRPAAVPCCESASPLGQ